MLKQLMFIVMLSCLPFMFSLDGDFVFDDSEAILRNKDVTSGSIEEMFSNDFWGTHLKSNLSHKSYRPLTILTFRFNFLLAYNSFNAWHFKVTNLACHIICCVLVWWSYLAILRQCGYYRKQSMDIAFLATSLFAVHPIHTEAVSGIVGRADLLAAITFFTSFILFDWTIEYDNRSCTLMKWFCLFFTIIIAAASMLFKENGITVLGLCIIYEIFVNLKLGSFLHDIFINLKFQKQCFIEIKLVAKNSFLRIAFLISGIFLLLYIRWAVMGHSKPNFKSIDNPTAFSDSYFTRLATCSYIYFLNLLLLIWPQWLCFDWSMGCVPLIENILDSRILLTVLLYIYVVGFVYTLFFKSTESKNKRLIIMALAILLIPFLPAANIFFNVGFVLAERILYIPSAGYCLLVAAGFHIIKTKFAKYTKILKYAFSLLVIIYATKTWQRSFDWQNEYNLFISGLRVCPLNAKVHYNVAKVADAKNYTEWALFEYKESIRLHPQYYQAMNNLANLLKNLKSYSEAEHYLKQAIHIKPDFPAAWMNLGIVFASTGKYKDAEIAYKRAIEHRKNYPDCYYNLGNLYLDRNEKELAIESWQHAIHLNPQHVLAWSNLLALLDNTGRSKDALEMIQRALAVLPMTPSIHFVAANIYGKIEKYELAENHFFEALRLFGDHVQAIHYSNFGVLYHRWKKYSEALKMYKKALEINPGFKSALNNMYNLQRTLSKLP